MVNTPRTHTRMLIIFVLIIKVTFNLSYSFLNFRSISGNKFMQIAMNGNPIIRIAEIMPETLSILTNIDSFKKLFPKK